jgi:hypothetical protein
MKEYGKYKVSLNAEKRTYDGIIFDSVQEMNYYTDIILPGVESGFIVSFERQKRYVLQNAFLREGKKVLPIEYKADFYVEYANGKRQVIDIKGCADPLAKTKRKMFWYVYPDIDYIWLSYSKIDGGWVTYENKQNGIKQRKKIKMEEKRRLEDEKKSKKSNKSAR